MAENKQGEKQRENTALLLFLSDYKKMVSKKNISMMIIKIRLQACRRTMPLCSIC